MMQPSTRAYVGVTVIDPTGLPPRPDQTVIVTGSTITAVGPAAQVPVPADSLRHDLSGKFVIPGLVDMHVHSEAETDDPRHFAGLYIANGVTAVREMWGRPALHEIRRRIESGELIGPRMTIASPLLDGSPALWSDVPDAPVVPVTSPDRARRAVSEAIDGGADFIKVYSRLSPEAYRAVIAEAGRRNVVVAGHRSDNVPFLDQIESGQRSFEHLFGGIWPAASADVERLEAAMASIRTSPEFHLGSWLKQVAQVEWDAVTSYDRRRASSVFDRLVAADVAYTPTLAVHAVIDRPESIRLDDRRMDYLVPGTPESWDFLRAQIYCGGGRSDEEASRHRDLLDRRRATVAAMDQAGVRLLAGTDSVGPGLFPGASLHLELEQLVAAGLTPLRALRCATVEPARFLGRGGWAGTVEADRVADLVVLDADPLADIRNTRRIHAVVVDGRYIGPDERDGLLTTAQRIAGGNR
ncbi:Amidohydrolase family protein [Pseudonocardia ammonioxydans]|uniref:Amidohydrolase family protein n=1 Tax=Pseudonocardia ammonioxydans TaxID=260086 RepID=A0A1I4ZW32_PSUAM|nr:amidohydrolase family protein [Pseudonocardia ammonioxydans]SFN54444.1 Amidohydrolase family protein [Pseudonocardia ammonioxydans]